MSTWTSGSSGCWARAAGRGRCRSAQDRPSTRPLRAGARGTSPSPLPHLWVGRNGPHDPVRDLPRPRPWSAPERAMPACHQATGSRPTSAQAACLCAHMSQDRATGSPAGRRGERILIRYRGLSAVRTAVFPGRWRASGAKGCVLSDLVPSGAGRPGCLQALARTPASRWVDDASERC